MVKDDPVAIATPPNAVLYQLNVPPVPLAVNVAVLPSDTVTLAGETLGAAGEAFKVITCTLEKEVLFKEDLEQIFGKRKWEEKELPSIQPSTNGHGNVTPALPEPAADTNPEIS